MVSSWHPPSQTHRIRHRRRCPRGSCRRSRSLLLVFAISCIRSIRVVVAGFRVLQCHFKPPHTPHSSNTLPSRSRKRRQRDAITTTHSTLVEFGKHEPSSSSVRVEVTGSCIRATRHFKFVTHTVAVGIIQAVAVAVVAGFWSVAFAVACAVGNADATPHSSNTLPAVATPSARHHHTGIVEFGRRRRLLHPHRSYRPLHRHIQRLQTRHTHRRRRHH